MSKKSQKSNATSVAANPPASLFGVLVPYRGLILLLIVFTIVSNALGLWVPKIIASSIDSYGSAGFNLTNLIIEFSIVAIFIFLFTYLQNIVQVYASEKVARDLRRELSVKISLQSHAYVEQITPAKLLTNLTSDIDSIKTFVSMAIASIISSIFLIIGSAILLLLINWKLGLAILTVIPIIGGTFYFVLGRVRELFKKAQETIDWLNKIINESILGAALIRLLNSEAFEYQKFVKASSQSKDIGMQILSLFASLIPVITFCTNLATLIILTLGGSFVIGGSMSLGDFTAFNSYLAILIFPVLIIGFMSSVIAQAQASYGRIKDVLGAPEVEKVGGVEKTIKGDIVVSDVSVQFGEKYALKDVSLRIDAGKRTAIIGPTAAGKTQLLYLLTGLLKPTKGEITYDGTLIPDYNQENLHKQVAFVFQDSVMFNLSVRENIAFSTSVTDASLEKAIQTAELHDFIGTLPQGLDTVVSERGSTLSGGQKQRIMLARALALNPSVLLLDDFTARVDTDTERRILKNLATNYPHLTLVSITQKISSVEQYDQIILLMEGEVLASGTHETLLKTSPEYVQIFESQRSTSEYE